jgi:hypothetical protein
LLRSLHNKLRLPDKKLTKFTMNFLRLPFRNFLILAPCLAGVHTARGAVTYVDPVDIVIPFSYGGVYLDIVTAASNGAMAGGSVGADSYTLSFSEPASGDWDLNFFFGGAGIAHNQRFQPYRADSTDNLSAIHNVLQGSFINGGPINPEPATGVSAVLGIADFGGSGSGTGGGLDGVLTATHMGLAGNQFASGTPGYIAFVQDPGTATETFGWIGVTLSDDGSTGLIRDWAYSDVALNVGEIPEPSSVTLLLMAGLTLLRRQR